jgi:hypothetical protein
MLVRSGTGGPEGSPTSCSCCERSENRAAELVGEEKTSVSCATTLLARVTVSASNAAVLVLPPPLPPPLTPVALPLPLATVEGEMSSETLTEQD